MIRRRRRRTADFSDFLTRHAVRSDSFLTKTKEQIKAEIFLLREKRGGEKRKREMENSSVLRDSTAQVKSNLRKIITLWEEGECALGKLIQFHLDERL